MNLSLNRIKSQNQMTNIYIGSALLILSILDVFLNSFFRINISGSLPGNLSIFFPLILGFLGLSYLRTEYSGYKFLDSINKNINTTNFNAFLTLFITFAILKAFPPALSWMVLDANISGDTKEACTGTGACWTYIKVWFKRFMYGMYPNELHWRINSAFLLVIGLGFVGYFFKENLKKGALNLILNCAELSPHKKVLIVAENEKFGWYDKFVAKIVQKYCTELEIATNLLKIGEPTEENSYKIKKLYIFL